ncbi:MAG: alpha-2-macroglobulin family protein [Candidatus Zixiibacteriota bacterium]|nr:MAG: alpha-2-macroglobulin family protein [candidate division Zixibacteria bacterium]
MPFLKNYKAAAIISAALIFAAIVGLSALLTAQPRDGKPDLNVKVVEFYPKGVVDRPSNITVKFSNDLVPDESLNKLTSDIPLKFDPPLPGLARWIDNDELRYFPDSMFLPSTEYKVIAVSEKPFIDGNRINDRTVFEFRTPTFVVEHVRTEIINVPEQPNQNRLLMHISFNYPVDYEVLLEHIKTNMKVNGRPIEFETRDMEPSRRITLFSEPFRPQEVHGKFTFSITAGLNCIGGRIPLQADFKKEYNIPKPSPLVINRVTPETAGKNGRITIYLSQSVALKDVEEYISITPEVDITTDQRYSMIHVYGDFKPGEVYTINISKGLSSLNGQILERDFSTKVEMPDLKPSLKFTDEGYFLPRESHKLIAIETVNVSEISIEVEQVFVNNIVYYLGDRGRRPYYGSSGNVGRRIFSREYFLPSSLNEPVNSTFELGEIVGDSLQGIYVVSVRAKNRRWDYAQRRVMITDLGISARLSDNYLMVWVNSLSDIEPVKKARVSLISNNNQILCDGYTNSDGVAIFEDIAPKSEGFTPFVITAAIGNDLSYLKFSECLLPSAEFGIKGRPFLTKGYETFIYSDRGVYRPGETVHLVSVVRGKNGELPDEFPYVLEILDPQGREFRKMKLSTANEGIESIDLEIPTFAKTGAYNALAKIGEDVIGSYIFQVEEFMPDRIKTILTTDKENYSSGEEMTITVNGTYLFGAPCDGNRVNGRIEIEPEPFKPGQWPEYSFIAERRRFTNIKADLPASELDKDGVHVYNYTIPDNLNPPSALRMLLSATVLESGGRGVSAYKGLIVYPYPVYVGIKSDLKGYARAGQDVSYSVITVDNSGNIVPDDSLRVKFYRIIYHTIVKKDNLGIYRYVSEEEEHIIDSTMIAVIDKPARITFTPMEYGSYRIKAFGSKTEHYASASFYASGWGYAPWSMTNPDRIELELDKDNYKAGETARLLVKAPFAGKLLLDIEQDKVLEYRTYTLDSNTAEITLKVKREYSPNIYITATLIKSTMSLERFSPPRAFGLISLNSRNDNKLLRLNIDAPDKIRPNETLTVKIKAEPNSKLTLAAVDYGIIQLTDFMTPDPFKFFFGKRRPSLRAYDIYSFIFPDIEPAQSMLSAAGDMAFEAARKRHVSPFLSRRVKPVALWSGLIIADSTGNATVDFAIPQFNGKIRLMAVAFNADKCGSNARDVTVKENIIIQESLPRFMTFSDTAIAKITVFNNTGKDGAINIIMDASGPARIISDKSVGVFIPDNRKETVNFAVLADDQPGDIIFEISASGESDTAHVKVELPNRPPQPLVTRYGSGIVRDGEPSRFEMASDWLEGTGNYQLRVSSVPALRFARSIQYLLSYPHGCVEQTTSKVFPLLYFNDIARVAEPGIFGGKGPDYFIAEGIIKLSGMNNADGSFSYWPGRPDSRYPWGSIYAAHFLAEARKAGYYVNDKVYKNILKYLKRVANDASLENNRGVLRIYAAYVLALADELDNATLEGLKYLNLEKLPLYSKFQYAGAIAMKKGPDEALWLLPVEVHPQNYEPETGGFFNSSVRANAILLEILSEITPENPSIPVLMDALTEDLTINRWYTTQGTAWGLMAIGKYLRSQEIPNYDGTITINGKRYKNFGVEQSKFKDSALADGQIEISINGTGNCYYYWQASGVPSTGLIEEYDKRLKTRREYLTDDKKPLNLNRLNLGDQIIVKLTAEALDKDLENVIINDLLPTCLEVENPRLETSGRGNRKGPRSSAVDYMDIRDDRLLLFTSLQKGRSFDYYYMARVIAAGGFLVPPVSGECMYDPTIRSAGSSGRISVNDVR